MVILLLFPARKAAVSIPISPPPATTTLSPTSAFPNKIASGVKTFPLSTPGTPGSDGVSRVYDHHIRLHFFNQGRGNFWP